MIKEKMLELLILYKILDKIPFELKTVNIHGKEYDTEKLFERAKALNDEFLEPYVIDPTRESI